MKRRSFLKNSSQAGIAVSLLGLYACKETKKTTVIDGDVDDVEVNSTPFFKLSLAQWSIHKMIRENGVNPYTFAEKAKSWGFSGLEYVSQLYRPELEAKGYSTEAMKSFVDKCNAEAEKHGMENVLIMVDGEGELSVVDSVERKKAVTNHFKWVDAAAAMGCHSIRVNLMGVKTVEEWISSSVDALTQLATYAKDKKVNVIVENHGGFSSDAGLLVSVMKQVNMDNCGTLPDFGNFCVKREDGSYYNGVCIEEYDIYKGVTELLPYSKAVSAKSYDFDADGNETKIDYAKMLKIVKDSKYTGFIGVEYEGNELSEEEGILATKQLMLKVAKSLG